jgi:hypothetical protein
MAKPKPAADPAIALLVDEIGDLHAQLDPLKPKTARLELLRKSLRKHYEEKAADAYFTAEGLRYSILLGPKENKAIGAKVFQRIARVTLTALQAEAPHAIAAEGVITIEPTGTRSLKVLEKGKANG